MILLQKATYLSVLVAFPYFWNLEIHWISTAPGWSEYSCRSWISRICDPCNNRPVPMNSRCSSSKLRSWTFDTFFIRSALLSSAVESVLLYASGTWTLTEKLSSQLDGCYTRMLRTALNIHWNQLLTNEQLYGSLPKISEKIRRRRLKLAGHCRRSDGEIAANLVLWTPKHGQRKQGRPALT